MNVAAIVVNYRTAEAAIDSVKALLVELDKLGDSRVVVVDNESGDGSLERLVEAARVHGWGPRVVVIPSGHNGGYGYGINVGAQEAMSWPTAPRYLYIINPDATPLPGAIDRLVRFMDENPSVGLTGSTVHNDDGSFVSAFRFPSLLSEFESNANLGIFSRLLDKHRVALKPPGQTVEVDWVPGTSMLIRNPTFAEIGRFDEDFFLYFEEIDLCRRIRDAGYEVYFVEGAGVKHIGSLATGMGDESKRMPGYWFSARRRYFVKHHGRLYAAACDAAMLGGHVLRKAADRVLSRQSNARPHFGRDLLRYALAHVAAPAPLSAAPHSAQRREVQAKPHSAERNWVEAKPHSAERSEVEAKPDRRAEN
ncbi:MAG: glycosyltransferase family 2 protein [Deltaproteobacteria bacterium]